MARFAAFCRVFPSRRLPTLFKSHMTRYRRDTLINYLANFERLRALASDPPCGNHLAGNGLLLICLDELDTPGLTTNGCKEDNSEESAKREDRQGRCIIWCFGSSKILSQERFQEHYVCCKEVAELVSKTRKCSAYIGRREFV